MPPENKIKASDVILSFDGKEMSFQSTQLTHAYEPLKDEDIEINNGDSIKVGNFGATITLDSISLLDISPLLMPADNLYTVEFTGYRLPKGVKMPKKKRLRKKFMKKYGYQRTFENCYIEDVYRHG
jgi:hypothetical protein